MPGADHIAAVFGTGAVALVCALLILDAVRPQASDGRVFRILFWAALALGGLAAVANLVVLVSWFF